MEEVNTRQANFGGHIGSLIIDTVKYNFFNFYRRLLILNLHFCSVFNNQLLMHAWINEVFIFKTVDGGHLGFGGHIKK